MNKNFNQPGSPRFARDDVLFFTSLFVCFAFSFYIPAFLLLVFFLLLFFKEPSLHHPFRVGWLCGILFFCIHMFGFIWVAAHNGTGFVKYLYPLLLCIYCGFYTGVWLKALMFFRGRKKRAGRLTVTFLYFWFVHSGIFFIFGRWEGYPLASPLVPAVSLLSQLKKAGRFFFASLVCQREQKKEQKTFVALPLLKKETPYEMAQNICLQLLDAVQEHPEARVFILPESAFPFVLTEHPYALTMWHDNVLHDNKYLMLGSHSRIDGNLYNSFLLVHQCRIIQCYNKSHLVPFFEHVPLVYQRFRSFKALFLSRKEQFIYGESLPPKISFGDFQFLPVICSELFYKDFYKEDPNIPLLSLMNDSYFKGSGYSRIMLNYAKYLSMTQKRGVIYASSFKFVEIKL